MDDELWLGPEEMRQFGYRTVDLLVDHLAELRSAPLIRRATRAEMEARLSEPAPEQGTPAEDLLDRLRRDVLPFIARQEHPGFMAFIPSCSTWPGALGDLIASGANLYAGSWMESAGPTQLELTVLEWFKGWIGYPVSAGGVLVSGGSAANMTAFACAREALFGAMSDRVVAYCSDQSHSSVARAARALGFRPDQVRVIPSDQRYRMRVDMLASAMESDVRAGRHPLFVSANAGSTNTGSIDPLSELADLCREEGVWLHVDAAYGGFAAITERGSAWLAGIERADSVTLDPHKWLFQPFDVGCLLVREGSLLRRAFEIAPDYLHDAQRDPREVNLADYGFQLSRSARAIKVWLSVSYFGLDRFRRSIDRGIDLAEHAQRRIEASDDLELLSPRSLGIVCFRRIFGGETDEAKLAAWNQQLLVSLEETGRALLSSTRLRGRYALRIVVLGHTTKQEDVDWVLDWIEHVSIDREAPSLAPTPGMNRSPDVEEGWLGRATFSPDEVRAIPLFAGLSDAWSVELAHAARWHSCEPGETVVERWEQSRDFFVVVEGLVEVSGADGVVATIGTGGFFGELAALEWGADFSYSRSATVVALEPTRLAVVPPAVLNRMIGDEPSVAEPVRAALRARLDGA